MLVGFMGSGKSTIGGLLAARLAIPFVDIDRKIEADSGTSIAAIFKSKGEASFREAERATILNLLDDTQRVIAVGGGAFMDEITRSKLKAATLTIWLDTPYEIIRTRLACCSERPIAAASTDEQLHALWLGRRSFYAQAAMHIESSHEDPHQTVSEIMRRLVAT